MQGLAGERCEFSLNLSKLELYARSKNYFLARDEGRVLKERKVIVRVEATPGVWVNSVKHYSDAVHEQNSLHYQGLAQDYNLYIDDVYITADNIAWHDLASYWKALNPKCTWGGDFKTRNSGDFNHFSWGEGQ